MFRQRRFDKKNRWIVSRLYWKRRRLTPAKIVRYKTPMSVLLSRETNHQRKETTVMKKLYVIAISAALLGVLAAPAVFAKGKKDKNAPTQTMPSDVYAQYDKNGNGVLDADEKDAIRKDYAKDPNGPLKIYDLNNDGKLSDDEIAAIPATKVIDAPPKKKKNK
jgi:hypothetical protein